MTISKKDSREKTMTISKKDSREKMAAERKIVKRTNERQIQDEWFP